MKLDPFDVLILCFAAMTAGFGTTLWLWTNI